MSIQETKQIFIKSYMMCKSRKEIVDDNLQILQAYYLLHKYNKEIKPLIQATKCETKTLENLGIINKVLLIY